LKRAAGDFDDGVQYHGHTRCVAALLADR
jgi:hypothetical protein